MRALFEIKLSIKAQTYQLEKTKKRLAELNAELEAYHINNSTWVGRRENNEVVAEGNFVTVKTAMMNRLSEIYGVVTTTSGGATLLGFGSGGVIVGTMQVKETE